MVRVPPKDVAAAVPESPANVIDELAKLALVIPADPERLVLVKPVMVFDPAAMVLLVRAWVVSVPTRVVVASGSVQVLAAVKSADVIVPVKALVVVVDWGKRAKESDPDVVDDKVQAPDPLRVSLVPILVSDPVAVHVGEEEAAALANVR